MTRSLPAWLLLLSVAVPVAALSQTPPPDRPRASGLEEQVDVRMVQVVLSVVDRRANEFSSVRNIPKDDFIIKLNGRELSPEQKARTVIDEMCEETVAPREVQAAIGRRIPERPIIVLVDFNYLDAQGRFNVARALRKAASNVDDSGVEYKIYGYTRELEILTPTKGFVRDPGELLIAAARIENTAYTRRGVTDASGSEIGGPASQESSTGPVTPADLDIDAPGASSSTALPGGPGGLGGQNAFFDNSLFDEIGPETDFNPTASLGAIERIMVIHSSIPWLKTILLFSSEQFGYADPQKEENAIEDLLRDRKGYKFWPVIASGPPELEELDVSSRILSSLAGNTGGYTTRGTPDLYRAIDGASAQLSCYYLISVPVPVTKRPREYKLTVQLDREGKDENTADKYFRYDLQWDRDAITFRDPVARNRELRMAALFSPDDFPDPPLTVTIDHPSEPRASEATAEAEQSRNKRKADKRKAVAEMKIRFRVRLADLEWTESSASFLVADKRFSARFLPALVVEHYDKRGSDIVCEFDVENDGIFRTKELEVSFKDGKPNQDDPFAISVEYTCPLRKLSEGLYVARGILTDIESEKIAAGRSSVYLQRLGENRWAAFAPRMETVTSRELLWRAATKETKWDAEQDETWRELQPEETARIDDRLALRYVLCGPEDERPAESVEHVLFRAEEDGAKLEYFLGSGLFDLDRGASDGRRELCPSARVVIEPFTITRTGTYLLVTYLADVDKDELVQTVESTPPARLRGTDGILAAVPFSVAE